MVARSDSMFSSYDSYSYRLWSLANIWNTCQFSSLANGIVQEEGSGTNAEYFIKCSQCQKSFQSFLALKEHMEVTHMESATSSEYGTPSNTLSPTPSLIGSVGTFTCSQCTSSFSNKDHLEKHELLHSPNAQVSCKICNKTFANVYRLQRHMISHDESAVLRKFKCTECDKAFKFKHHLKEHIRIHSGEKPFECGNCRKRFSHSGSYSSHMTSKKCLIMNLKLGKTRTFASSIVDKNIHQNSHLQKCTNRGPVNNTSNTSNHNSFLPILPKYSEGSTSFFQSSLSSAPSLTPFYLTHSALLNTSQSQTYNLPTLSQILDHLHQRTLPHLHNFINEHENQDEEPSRTNGIEIKLLKEDERGNLQKSDDSSCEDLISNEGEYSEQESKVESIKEDNDRGDLETVNRILETVNVTVTKQLLQANMQKLSFEYSNNSDCQSNSSQNSLKQKSSSCSNCNKTFDSSNHICNMKSEGLAAKLEDALLCQSDRNDSFSGNEDQDYERSKYNEDMYCESVTTTDHVCVDGGKVRVRSLISDEQLKVLKDNYTLNPRPKREDLERISTVIGFPVRVVQVWFQNTRARDRREGKLIHMPYSSTSSQSLKFHHSISTPSFHPFNNKLALLDTDEPLDLSTKRNKRSLDSTPSSSPTRPISENPHSEFCHKSLNSSASYMNFLNNYRNTYSSDQPNDSSPLTLRNRSTCLAQILGQPTYKFNLPSMGLVPIEKLIHFGVAEFPNLSHLIDNNRSPCNINITSEKGWNYFKDMQSDNVDDDTMNSSKKMKISHHVLKNSESPLLGNQEPELEGQFICDQCEKAFSKQSSLARHKYEHSGQRPHKCDECPKAFKHKHHLTEHKRLHSGEKPFQCTKCLKRFSHSGSYSQHMNHRYSYCKPYRE